MVLLSKEDSNQDGLLAQTEIVDVLYAHFLVSYEDKNNTNEENPEDYLNKITNSVKTAFGNKTHN